MASSAAEITARIDAQAQRLRDEPELNARVKKRIFQKIGKMKSELAALGATYVDTAGVTGEGNDDEDGSEAMGEAEGDAEAAERPKKRAKASAAPAAPAPSASAEDADDHSDEPITARPVLSRKEAKAMTHFVAKQLSDCAVKKQLPKAKQLVRQSIKKGLVMDVHTYTNLINVYVRCGDMAGASRTLQQMRSQAVPPNIVTFTTLLRGHCEAGHIREAEALYAEMLSLGVHSRRSLSTFLRGCLRTGSVHAALRIYNASSSTDKEVQQQQQEDEDEHQDVSIAESLVSLLCRSGQYQRATEVVLAHMATSQEVLESAALYLQLARYCALRGIVGEGRKYLALATGTVSGTAQGKLTEKMRSRFTSSATSSTSEEVHGSAALFAEHKAADLLVSAREAQHFLDALPCTPEAVLREAYARALGQLLIFGYDGAGDLEASTPHPLSTPEGVCRALDEKLGLHLLGSEEVIEEVRQRIRSRFDGDRLRAEGEGEEVHLEVGAGRGEWIVAQAEAAPAHCHWVAVELRLDRSHDILCRHHLLAPPRPALPCTSSSSSSGKLTVLSGDAVSICSQRISSGSIAHVFINYPQPPAQGKGAQGQGQGTHLLTAAFFLTLHRALRPKGRMTVLTDNLTYAVALATTLAASSRYCDAPYEEEEGVSVQQAMGCSGPKAEAVVTVYRGLPGPACGHQVASSSYFDRLWAHGMKKRRWFLFVERD